MASTARAEATHGRNRRHRRWWLRRLAIVAVVGAQAVALGAAYRTPHKVFGWQMFPESSEWVAEIYRIETDGARHPISDPWPGGYRWADLVDARGLDDPGRRQHAAYGLDSTLDLLGAALEWIAANTPLDDRTSALEALVTTWHNGRDPVGSRISVERTLGRS